MYIKDMPHFHIQNKCILYDFKLDDIAIEIEWGGRKQPYINVDPITIIKTYTPELVVKKHNMRGRKHELWVMYGNEISGLKIYHLYMDSMN